MNCGGQFFEVEIYLLNHCDCCGLNLKDEAVCIIQTTKTTVVPFDEVSEEHAYKEGEGDRSLAYWRVVHEEFFTKEFEETEIEFNGQTRILCEEFKVVYKAIDVN